MHTTEAVSREQSFSKSGGTLTKTVTIEHPAQMSITGSVHGHASMFTSDQGFFRFVSPSGQALVNVSAKGESAIFSPKTVSRDIRFSGALGPGVYTVQLGGTNDLSGGSAKLSWIEQRPKPHPEPEETEGPAEAATAIFAGDVQLGGIKLPRVAVVGAAALLAGVVVLAVATGGGSA